VLFAKQLIHETRLPMAEIALAAGFGSVRRFNATFRRLYGRPPRALRRSLGASVAGAAGVTLFLRYRPPYDWDAMLAHLALRAVDGIECVERGAWRRTLAEEGAAGTVEVRHAPARQSLQVTVRFPSLRALPAILARVRRVFDVGADIDAINAHLSQDPRLAALVALRPGLRAPGGWDGFELALRAVLGQQVTLEAARRLVGRLVALCGAALPDAAGGGAALTHLFPTPASVAAADLASLPMPGARKAALKAVAEAALAEPGLFRAFGTVEEAVARLRAIRGVGEWTAQYIALRALRAPDAFPASDVGLLRGAAGIDGVRPSPADLARRAEPWRPWRAYAAQHLWTHSATLPRGAHG
jgi:AraC family transcriptional regulator of adaptative response / DNA-3-methyladenine glycosylase II